MLGLGNVLRRDDALGPHVIENLLAGYEFPSAVTVADLGTPGLNLHPYLADCDALIIVDTVRTEGPAGEVHLYRKDDILRHAPQPRLSPHDPGLQEALLSLDFAGQGPREVLLVGVVPESTASEVGLSATVCRAVPRAEAAVLAELARLGHAVTRCDPPRQANIWWEGAGAEDTGPQARREAESERADSP